MKTCRFTFSSLIQLVAEEWMKKNNKTYEGQIKD